MKLRSLVAVAAIALTAGACAAIQMTGPKPVKQDAVVMHVNAAATPEQIAQTLTQQGAEYAIISAPAGDSAWFATIATRVQKHSTRPGRVNGRTYAFIGPKALGDTTLTLTVPGGGKLRIHDALFEVDKNRRIDLMAVQLDSTVNLQRSITRLLEYVAADVGATVSVLLAIETPTAAMGDSVSVIMRALYTDVFECTAEGKTGAAPKDLPIRAFYGPPARMRCNRAERIGNGTLVGHYELGL